MSNEHLDLRLADYIPFFGFCNYSYRTAHARVSDERIENDLILLFYNTAFLVGGSLVAILDSIPK